MKRAHHYLNKLIMLLLALCLTSSTWATTSPVGMLENSTTQMIAALAKNQAQIRSNPHQVESLVNQYLLPHMDVDNMSRTVVGRQAWQAATPQQQATFKSSFQKLVVRTYSSALAQYNEQTVRYAPSKESLEGRKFIQVNSVIDQKSGPSMNVNYRLVLQDSEWKVYDFSVDGVSMVQSYRSQFTPILNQSGMEGLLTKLSAHNK